MTGLPMTEKAMTGEVLRVAKEWGWLVYHTFFAKWSARGFPDIIAVRGEKVLALELKSERGKVTAAQEEWLEALSRVQGIEGRVVRPADLESCYRALMTGLWPEDDGPSKL